MKIHFKNSENIRLFGHGISLYVLLIFVCVLVLIWQLPISWFAGNLGSKTDCRMVIYQAQGTIWNGSASLGFSEMDTATGVCRSPSAFTERFQWANSCNVFDTECKGSIEFSALKKPLQYALDWDGARVTAGEITLPVNILEALGSPWSSLHPRGEMLLTWSDLLVDQFHKAGSAGDIQIKIHDLSSAISPVKPLGSYELGVTLSSSGSNWEVHTISGPLLIRGKGRLDHQQLHFSGDVSASPEAEESLVGLMSLLGKRNGSLYLIDF